MIKDELRDKLDLLGWSQLELSRRVEVSFVTVSRWSTGKARVPGSVGAYLDLALAIKGHGELVK